MNDYEWPDNTDKSEWVVMYVIAYHRYAEGQLYYRDADLLEGLPTMEAARGALRAIAVQMGARETEFSQPRSSIFLPNHTALSICEARVREDDYNAAFIMPCPRRVFYLRERTSCAVHSDYYLRGEREPLVVYRDHRLAMNDCINTARAMGRFKAPWNTRTSGRWLCQLNDGDYALEENGKEVWRITVEHLAIRNDALFDHVMKKNGAASRAAISRVLLGD